MRKEIMPTVMVLIFLTAFMIGYTIKKPGVYYCRSRDMVMECDTMFAKSCTKDGLEFICPELWQNIEKIYGEERKKTVTVWVNANGLTWACDAKDKKIGLYSICFYGGKQAYLGELLR